MRVFSGYGFTIERVFILHPFVAVHLPATMNETRKVQLWCDELPKHTHIAHDVEDMTVLYDEESTSHGATPALFRYISSYPNLTHLTVNVFLSDFGDSRVDRTLPLDALSSLENLQSLRIWSGLNYDRRGEIGSVCISIDPLKTLVGLRTLEIFRNVCVNDLTPLSHLTNLTQLRLEVTKYRVNYIDPCLDRSGGRTDELSPITLSPLMALQKLKYLDIQIHSRTTYHAKDAFPTLLIPKTPSLKFVSYTSYGTYVPERAEYDRAQDKENMEYFTALGFAWIGRYKYGKMDDGKYSVPPEWRELDRLHFMAGLSFD